MKNFTHNFKQFTSRLSARWLIMALMLLVGTSSAWATIDVYPGETIIIDVSSHSWFNNDNCYPKLYCGNTVIGQASGYDSNKKYEITLTVTSVVNGTLYVSRCNSNGEYNKQYIDDRSSSKINTFKITGDGNGKWNTTQSSTNIYYLRGLGDFDKWNNIKTPYTIYLNKGEYEFKVYDSNDNWYGNNGTMARDNCSNWTMETDKNNCKITADVAGNYIFTFNSTTKQLSVTYPELPCYTLSDVDPGTISSNATNNAICGSGSVELTLSNTTSKNDLTRTIQWQKYIGSAWSNISNATAITYTETISATTKYRAKVTWAKSGCNNLVEYSSENGFTITVNALPSAPSFDAIPAQCGSYTLPTEDKNKVSVNWYDSNGNKITSVTQSGTYYAEAVDGTCVSENRTDVEITIKTKPTISISGSEEAVLYEDVELIAATNGTSISWEITEGDGSLSSTTGNSVTLTSSSAGTVIVTATATLGSCTATDTHEVEFSAENCTPVPSNDIQITFTHPAKNNNNAACQYWGLGDLYYSTNNGNSYTKVSPSLGTSTSGSITRTISNLTVDKIKVYFQAYYEYTNCRAKTTVVELDKGNSYSITISLDQQGNGNGEKEPSVTKTGSLTQNPAITAPAVKMISAEYDEENDVIVAKGAVYKTGCGVTFWGFQYSEDGQTWGGTDADYIRPNSGNSLTEANEFDYSFPIPDANGGETYYIRAYALNNYNNDDYNLSSAVHSTTYLPIEIPSKTINSATISLVDSEGNQSDDTEVCPQSTVYLKVSYDGGDFKDYEAADNFPGTNLELVNHDKANNYAIFSYTATATGVANITISNDNTSITTTDGVSITLKNVAPVNAPMISISQGTICEDGSATITVNNPIAELTYTLYKETEPIGNLVNYQTGDLTEAGSYTVRAEESICHNYANSMAVELKVVTSDVKIGLAVDKTTVNPWQPLKLTVTPPEGYAYSIDGLADVVYTQSGDVYTIKIPRPNGWSPGNSGDPVETMSITFSAKIQVTDDLTCGTSSVNVTLADTEENCK